MNSWLGGGLSSLKGQLSHLITEGTEEVSDPNVEIDIAKNKILELESQIKSDTNEINDLKERNSDLKMKLQSEELLLQNVSESYQEKLREKEEIIEALTNKLSKVSQISDNHRDSMIDNNRLSTSDDGYSNDYFDNFHFSKISNDEINFLHNKIKELNQEIVKWKSLLERNQDNSDFSSSSFDATINRLLEDQQRELELQHSNYILELQQEHGKQVGFLNHKIHELERMVNEEDNIGPDSDDVAHVPLSQKSRTDTSAQTETSTDQCLCHDLADPLRRCSHILTKHQIRDVLNAVSEKMASKQVTLEIIIQRITCCENSELNLPSPPIRSPDQICDFGMRMPNEVNGDNQLSMKIAAQVKIAIADSLSQVSDMSEVSIKSRILDEHVRHLTDQIREYEKQIADIDGVSTGQQNIAQVKNISDKIENLKVKLCQRKHIVGQMNLTECSNEEPNSNIEDSWENSSANSLVEETAELRTESKRDLSNLAENIKDLYRIILPNVVCSDLSAAEMMQSIIGSVPDMVHAASDYANVEKQLMSLYNEMNCGTDANDPLDLFGMLEALMDNMRLMKETCSVHDYIIEENKSLQELVSQLRNKISILESEQCELIGKNSELDEQLMDMSITIARYEGLEKICDKYQKYMSTVGGKSVDKTNLSMDSDDILEHVETFNQEKDECIQSLESKIVSFQNLCEEKDDSIAELKQRQIDIIYEYDSLINVLNGELDSVRATVDNLHEGELSFKKQIQELNEQVKEKENMIKSLNEELTMLSMMDMDNPVDNRISQRDCIDGSAQTHNEDERRILAELKHQLEMLLTENQRLEKVIEAQATSLGQYEIKVNGLEGDLSKLSRLSNMDHESLSAEDMTKETLQHLSQMIRDKEWEIEALKSKNESLCAIIKCDGDNVGVKDVDYIDVLLAEKESLMKELNWYQENRDQLISSLNLKHKESLNYHGELQRLISYVNAEQSKWDESMLENEHMKEQLKELMEAKSEISIGQCVKRASPQLVDVGVSFNRDESPSCDECPPDAPMSSDQCDQLRARCVQLEDDNRQNASEIRSLQKQIEQISFELEQAHLQTVELTNNLTRTQQQLEYCQMELANQYKRGGASQPEDSTKDIWRTKFQEAEEDDGKSEAALMDEKEYLQQKLFQKQAECDNYSSQIGQLKARETKLLKEKQIFQDHLIKIEESYTQDATLAEDREQALRKQLHLTEDDLQAANIEIGKLQKVIANIRNELHNELNVTRLQRDDALTRLEQAESQLADHVKSLSNLQSALDNFQQDQASEMVYQKERLQQELTRVTTDRDRLELQCRKLQADIDDQRDLVDAAQRLTHQMEYKDDQLAQIQASLAKKEEQIDGLKMEIRKLNTFTESKVDKVLMKNLVIGYFHTPQHRRQEALKVIGSLLQFADTDYNQIGVDTANRSRWYSWLRPSLGADKGALGQDPEISGKSFSELFITFLEKESNPVPQVKLPINQIAVEARQHSSLSQSQEYPYTHHTSSISSIIDHHKFFTPSPVITKRNGSPSTEQTSNAQGKTTPLLYIPNIEEINSDINKKDGKMIPNHRRSESGRNALLSLLDQ